MFKSVSNLYCGANEEKIACVAFFRGIVVLATNYHQHTDILSVPGDNPQRMLTDTNVQL